MKLTIPAMLRDEMTRLIPLGEPDPEMLEHGRIVKTPPALRSNIEQIVSDAERHGTPVVLMTFAWHLPSDYSRENLKHTRLAK